MGAIKAIQKFYNCDFFTACRILSSGGSNDKQVVIKELEEKRDYTISELERGIQKYQSIIDELKKLDFTLD